MAPTPPTKSLTDLARDNVATILANYLREKINLECYFYTGKFLINTIRDFDDDTLQPKDYPVLKVFKIKEIPNIAERFIRAEYVISVELLLPEWNILVGILNWISQIISKYLFINEISDAIMPDPTSQAEISYNIKENNQLQKKTKYLNYKFTTIYNLEKFNNIGK